MIVWPGGINNRGPQYYILEKNNISKVRENRNIEKKEEQLK